MKKFIEWYRRELGDWESKFLLLLLCGMIITIVCIFGAFIFIGFDIYGADWALPFAGKFAGTMVISAAVTGIIGVGLKIYYLSKK